MWQPSFISNSDNMKRFLRDTLCTLTVFLVLVAVCECFVFPHIPNHYTAKYNYVETHKDSIRILLMGNSYAENSIDPTAIGEGTFDLAVSARWIFYDKQLLEDFVPRMSALQAVVFPMGYRVPFWSSHHYPENPQPYIDFVHEKFMHCWYDRFPDNVIRWLSIVQGGDEVNIFAIKIIPQNWTGQNPIEGQSPKWKEEHNISPEIIDAPDAMDQVAEYTQYLTDMARVCRDHGVRFIVVTPPCHDSFVENTRPKGIEIMHQIIEDVRKEYPIEYKDYLQDPAYRADAIYYNCSHLNNVGAAMFGAHIKADFNL